MTSKRIKVKIKELGKVVGGATPSTRNPENWGGSIPWVTPKDLANHRERFIKKGEKSISQKGYDSCSTKMLPKGTVLFSSRAPIGYCAIAENDICTNQGFKSIIPNENTDSLFLYYLLKSNVDAIANNASGTTFLEISGKAMEEIEVAIPEDKNEQRQIAQILDAFDKKIENNLKLNDYLNTLLDIEFNELVVKNSSSWKLASLLDIADYKNGLAMQRFRPVSIDAGLPVLKIRELGQGFCGSDAERCRSDIEESVIVHNGDLIFSWSGTLLLNFWAGGNAGLNQHLFKVTSNKYPNWFYYCWTKHHMQRFISMAKDRATTMGHIKRSALQESEVYIPQYEVMQKLTKHMQPLVDELVNSKVESYQLIKLKKSLLPKLISGQIDLSGSYHDTTE